MSVFTHFLRPSSSMTARRAYSVFSKPGGGRYFNSAKPPKVAAVGAQKQAGNDASSTTPTNEDGTSQANMNAGTTAANGTTTSAEQGSTLSSLSFPVVNAMPQPHPPINPQDLRLHQFFSLHRPLLTLSLPTTTLFEPASVSLTNFPPQVLRSSASSSDLDDMGMAGTIDEPSEPSAESDADAARQLARALVVNTVGPSLAWEDTLRRLGLDVDLHEGRVEEVMQVKKEHQVYLDSVKRKRRKKMKKHKLKKRRRLTRMKRISERG